MRLRFGLAAPALLSLLAQGGCSLLNAPDDITPGGDGGSGGAGPASSSSSGSPTSSSGPTSSSSNGGGGASSSSSASSSNSSSSSSNTGGSGGGPECTTPADCLSNPIVGDCDEPTCESGVCGTKPASAGKACGPAPQGDCDAADACDDAGNCLAAFVAPGTPCGDDSNTACTDPDTCDGQGTCAPNNATVGASCDLPLDCAKSASCDASGACVPVARTEGLLCASCFGATGYGACGCEAGACTPCADRAGRIDFNTPASLSGWSLSGGWNLYGGAPATFQSPSGVAFTSLAFGTDGNRFAPYPGPAEFENSTAVSPVVRLTNTLSFKSWHVDEQYDSQQLRMLLDTGEIVTLFACGGNLGSTVPLPPPNPDICQTVGGPRAGDQWDSLAFDTSRWAGHQALLEFAYNTGDACCEFEQGWFIDDLDFGCACASDADCGHLASECGTAACDVATGVCNVAPVLPSGASCGDPAANACTNPDFCSVAGTCERNDAPNDVPCGSPSGNPSECTGGECIDCVATYKITFDRPPFLASAAPSGGWGPYAGAPPTLADQSDPIFFSSTAYGTDGYRVQPYPGIEQEQSYLITGEFKAPATLEFDSWHVDHGIEHQIFIAPQGSGGAFQPLVDCAGGFNAAHAFCAEVLTRTGDDWDRVSIDMGQYAGQLVTLAFAYIAPDLGTGVERGWYLDNLNFGVTSCP